MKANPLPPVELVQELLDYDKETGIFKWKVNHGRGVAGNIAGSDRNGYTQISINDVRYKAHRLAWLYFYGVDPGPLEIDHKDRNRSNNAISNLRLATRKQNNENAPKQRNNTSGFRGVSWREDNQKWCAYIYHNNQKISIGFFDTYEEAVIARYLKEKEIFTHSDRVTGDGRGDSPCKGCQYEREDVAFQICVDCELSDYSLRSPVTVPAFKRVPLVSQCSRCGYETTVAPPQQQQAAPRAVLDGFVLVPEWKLRRAAEVLDKDGDEHGVGADLFAMLSAAPKLKDPA